MEKNEWKQYGLIWVRHRDPKYKVGEEVYFQDIFAEYMEYTIRKGKIVEAGDTETLIPCMAGEISLTRLNNYKIESEGIVYDAGEEFISKDKKELSGKDMTGE